MNNGIMLSADYATYSWTHKDLQEGFAGGTTTCSNSGLYGNAYTNTNLTGVCDEGIQDALALQAEINLAYNAHLYLGYTFTNKQEANLFGTGLDFAF